MTRALLASTLVCLLAIASGCSSTRLGHMDHPQAAADCSDGSCKNCGHGCRGGGAHQADDAFAGPHGPASGAVTYPYYTLRGPRDFLARNPRAIGP